MLKVCMVALVAFVSTLLTFSAAAATPVPAPAADQTAVTLDNVSLTIRTPFLSKVPFTVSSDMYPLKFSRSMLHPYAELTVKAIPYGTSDPEEAAFLAASGSSARFRSVFHQARVNEHGRAFGQPAASIFGATVTGESSIASLPLEADGYKDAFVAEWVVEAGHRVWIVRAVEEKPQLKQTDATGMASFYAALGSLSLTSATLNRSSSTAMSPMNPAMAQSSGTPSVGPRVNAGNYALPPSWNGNNCDTSHYSGAYSLDSWAQYFGYSSATFNGVTACGPLPVLGGADRQAYFSSTDTWGVLEWECVELSLRYLYVTTGTLPYPADGSTVVANYHGTKLWHVSNGTPHLAPVPGDILSEGAASVAGHTSVVIASTVDANGNGTITTLNENMWGHDASGNAVPYPVDTYYVGSAAGLPAWQVDNGVDGWLHDPTANTSNDDVFAIGSDAHPYDFHWSIQSGWSNSDLSSLLPSGYTVAGAPSAHVALEGSNVVEHAYFVGSNTNVPPYLGNLFEYYKIGSGSWTLANLSSAAPPPGGVGYTGSPSGFSYAIVNCADYPASCLTVHHTVFVTGTDGHLYYYDWYQGGHWTVTDLSNAVGLTSVSFANASPSGHAFTEGTNVVQHAFVIGSNGHLYEFYKIGGGAWNLADLSAYAPYPSNGTYVGVPSGFSYADPSDGKVHHTVFVVGTNNHLYYYDWTQGGHWSATDLTILEGGPGAFVSMPSGHAFQEGSTLVLHAFVTGNDSKVYEYYRLGSVWHLNPIGNYSPVGAIGGPSGFSYNLATSQSLRHSVFFMGADGHLRELYWIYGGTWHAADDGAPVTGVSFWTGGTAVSGFPH